VPRDTLLAKVAPRGVVAGVREHRQFFSVSITGFGSTIRRRQRVLRRVRLRRPPDVRGRRSGQRFPSGPIWGTSWGTKQAVLQKSMDKQHVIERCRRTPSPPFTAILPIFPRSLGAASRRSPALGVGRGFPQFPLPLCQSRVPDGRPMAGLAQLAQPVLTDGKRWWLKLWSPVEGYPKKAERCAWRRSSARECRQAYATTLLSSVKGHVARRAAHTAAKFPHRPQSVAPFPLFDGATPATVATLTTLGRPPTACSVVHAQPA
jgi:hypothetical protein